MLEKFLKYHQELISQDFVDGILKRIEKAYQTRLLILGIMSFIGVAMAVFAVNSLMDNSWVLSIKPYLLESKNIVYLALLVLALFLTNLFVSDNHNQTI